MTDLLADAEDVPDSVWAAAVNFSRTPAECAFRDVLRFHRDVLNGGLGQALWNRRRDCDESISAFETVGLKPLAALISFARRSFPADDNSLNSLLADDDLESLTSVYVAAAYNLAYVCAGNRDDQDFPLIGDSVERIALRFARANRSQFGSILVSAQEN